MTNRLAEHVLIDHILSVLDGDPLRQNVINQDVLG